MSLSRGGIVGARPGAPVMWGVAAAAAIGLAAVAAVAAETAGPRQALLVAIGAIGGVALYHASFGFTGAWRRFQRERRAAGVRAQLLLMASAAVVTFPLIAAGQAGGWVFPMGVASALGAMMFGVGMQLGGGCGSGSLFTVGGGSVRMMITLASFIAGSVIWTGTREVFAGLPRTPGVSLIREVGAPAALAATLAALGAIAWAVTRAERRAHGALEAPRRDGSLVSGPWSREFAALVLAGVVIACFLTLGRPWGITSAFTLWGAKIADGVGLPIQEWAAWRGGALDRAIFADATGVMNFGVMLGALAAAALAGAFRPSVKLSLRDAATAVIGGLLMGYGARLAFGCNIGGLIGGVTSASLHGWWWLAFGALGSVIGVRLRAAIGMDPPMSAAGR